MALYGGARDISMFRRVNRELMGSIISQEVIYYKYNITTTKTNMYGESVEGRNFADPVILFALIELGSPESPTSDLGVDFTWPITFRFLRDDLAGIDLSIELSGGGQGFAYGVVPEVGDVMVWQNNYYEVDGTIENQLFVGKDPGYSYSTDNDNFGSSISIIVNAHYTRVEKLGIEKDRL